jgi:hypothetical protein
MKKSHPTVFGGWLGMELLATLVRPKPTNDMKSLKYSLLFCVAILTLMSARSVSAQQIAYDDAGNYLINANWTNGANQGFGFTPWGIATNGTDFYGTFVDSGNSPTFVIASVTNVLGTNYTCIWGLFANGTNGINETTAYRGFTNPLGTNTFKLQWGSTGAGNQNVFGTGTVHGWIGFSLRTGNSDTNVPYSLTAPDGTAQLFVYFLDGASPSTIYFWDGNGVQSVPGTSFSNLGRNNITNAIEAEITPASDGVSYHMVLKDCVNNTVLFTTNSIFMNAGQTINSTALFCYEATGDQIYNRMQITTGTNIAPTISNLQPSDGSLYISSGPTNLSFEVDSFNSTVSSSAVSLYLNGVLQAGSVFNTASPTTQLLVTNNTTLSPNTFYNYTIVAQDAYGNVVSNNYTFNTFSSSNNVFIDAMDYNYNAGQFVNPSGVALYGGLLATNGIDFFDVTTSTNENNYRPQNLPTPQLIPFGQNGNPSDPVDHEGFNTYNSSLTDYQLAFTDQGEWDNYTRNFPTNTYTIYARAASASGGQFELSRLTNSTATVSNQPAAILGTFNVQNTGGSLIYNGQLSPLVDFFGNTVVMPLGGTNTLQQIATQSRTYNLSYLTFVPVATAGTLRPFISVGSPAPGATGVGLTSPISFTIANRQTTVTPASILVTLSTATTTSNLTTHLVLTNNLAGSTVTWTPTINLVALTNYTVTVIFTDSSSANVTNTWNFTTGTAGGVLGNGLWSGAGGANDEFWADAINWTGATPGPGFNAEFATPGATPTLVTNNIVATNVTILGLYYETNSVGYQTTWIQPGVTLTVTNGANASINPIVEVGDGINQAVLFNNLETNTITGNGGTLLVSGLNNPGNEFNFQVRQCTYPAVPNAVTLDMSGLSTLIATVGKFYLAQGGSGGAQSNVSACVNLAMTNIITCWRNSSGHFEVGDSSGGLFELPGSTLNLGISNALFVDNIRIGKQKATNNLVRFNPIFTSSNPSVYIRDTNGPTTRVTAFAIGDANTETTIPNFVQGFVDFSGGKVDALVNTLVLGQGETATGDSGYAQGTLTFTAGTLNVWNVTNGCQRANNTATETGVININGTALLISTNIVLAQVASGANASLVTGTLNVSGGTVEASIFAGGGVSTVNVNGGTIIATNTVIGTAPAPLTALNLTNASLQLSVNGSAPAANVYATAVGTNGTTTINIDSVANVTGPTTIHLISYAGADPYKALSLALPFGYTGTLVDNPGSIDLSVSVSPPQPPPTIRSITVNGGGQVVINATNNFGAGGTYEVLTSTNILTPLANWTVLTNGAFNASGNASSTNSSGTNNQQFYILKVP